MSELERLRLRVRELEALVQRYEEAHDYRSRRTREALAIRRAAGIRLGRPPLLAEETVRRIVRERAQGSTLAAIADGLAADGVPTAQGGRWHPATVRAVLRRKAAARLTGKRGFGA